MPADRSGHFQTFEGGTGITNIPQHEIVNFARAIEEYGDPRLYIGEPMPVKMGKSSLEQPTTDKALRFYPDMGAIPLAGFWNILLRVRGTPVNLQIV